MLEGWMTQKEIAKALGISRNSSNRILQKMFEDDLTEKFTAKDDIGKRRFNYVSVIKFIRKQNGQN